MAFSATLVQPEAPASNHSTNHNPAAASLLSAIVLSVYAAQKSTKNFRKLKRRFMWTAFKLKFKSLFAGKKEQLSNRTILIIIAAILALILIFVAPLAALIIALTLLILILAGVI